MGFFKWREMEEKQRKEIEETTPIDKKGNVNLIQPSFLALDRVLYSV